MIYYKNIVFLTPLFLFLFLEEFEMVVITMAGIEERMYGRK